MKCLSAAKPVYTRPAAPRTATGAVPVAVRLHAAPVAQNPHVLLMSGSLTNVGFRDEEHEIISAMPNRFICSRQGGLNASRPPCPRAVSARTCSPITLKVHRETVPADGRQAFQQLLAKCVPKREFSKAFTTLLNSHASRATGATKPRVLLMSGSLANAGSRDEDI